MKHGIEEVSGTIAGEGPSGAVGAMCARCQTDDDDARRRVTKGWDRTTPVLPFAPLTTALAGNLSAVMTQARAEFAGEDLLIERIERGDRSCPEVALRHDMRHRQRHGSIVERTGVTARQWSAETIWQAMPYNCGARQGLQQVNR